MGIIFPEPTGRNYAGEIFIIFIVVLVFILILAYIIIRGRRKKQNNDIIKPIEENLKYCQHCGTKIKKEAIYCEHCGTKNN